MKKTIYIANPFGTPVHFFDSREKFDRAYKAYTGHMPEYIGTPDGMTSSLEADDGDFLILVGWFEFEGQWRYSTLAHECSHAAFRICGRHGVHLEPDNNEVHAYLLSGMMDCFLGEG